jgi:predicted nucleotidyltransferase
MAIEKADASGIGDERPKNKRKPLVPLPKGSGWHGNPPGAEVQRGPLYAQNDAGFPQGVKSYAATSGIPGERTVPPASQSLGTYRAGVLGSQFPLTAGPPAAETFATLPKALEFARKQGGPAAIVEQKGQSGERRFAVHRLNINERNAPGFEVQNIESSGDPALAVSAKPEVKALISGDGYTLDLRDSKPKIASANTELGEKEDPAVQERFRRGPDSNRLLAKFGPRNTELRAGDRSNQTFKTLPEAANYARNLDTGAAVVAEGDQFAVYKLRGAEPYEKNFTHANLKPETGTTPKLENVDPRVKVLVTGDGHTIDTTGAQPAGTAPGSRLGRPESLSDVEGFAPGSHSGQDLATRPYGRGWTPLKAGDRSNQVFDTKEQAIAYARGLTSPAAVVNEPEGGKDRFAVYKLKGDFNGADVRLRNSTDTAMTMKGDVAAVTTSDGYVVTPQDTGHPQLQLAGSSSEDMTAVYGPGLSKLTSPEDKERAKRIMGLSLRDEAHSSLETSEQDLAALEARLKSGTLDEGDSLAIKKTMTEYARIDAEIRDKERQATDARFRLAHAQASDGLKLGSAASAQADIDRLRGEVAQLRQQRIDTARDNGIPILARLSPEDAASFGGKTDPDKIQILRGKIAEVRKDIAETKQNIDSGRLNLWTMGRVTGAVAENLSLKGQQMRWLEGQVKDAQWNDTAWKVGEGAISLALTAGMFMVPGGAIVRGVFWAGSAAINTHMTVSEALENRAINAATNTGISPNGGLIEQDAQRSWVSLALGLAGLGLDLARAVQFARQEYQLAKTAREYGAAYQLEGRAAKAAIREMKAAANARSIVTKTLNSEIFTARYGKEVNAVTLVHASASGRPRLEVVFRKGLTDAERAEAARHDFMHIRQAGEAKWRKDMDLVSERNLAGWSNKSKLDKLNAYEAKVKLEKDADERLAADETGLVTPQVKAAARQNVSEADAELIRVAKARKALMAKPQEALPKELEELEGDLINPPRLTATSSRSPVQGFSPRRAEKVARATRQLVRDAELPQGELVFQGSRIRGTARPDSDLDIALVVDDKKFFDLAEKALSRAHLGTRLRKSMMRRIMENGQLSAFDLGSDFQVMLRERLQTLSPYKIQFSVLKQGGKLHTGPFHKIGGQQP